MKTKLCKCGGKLKLDECMVDGFLAECMRCDKCGDVLFTTEQTKELIKLREVNKAIEGKRKIIKVGSSIAALLPKRLEDYGIMEGEAFSGNVSEDYCCIQSADPRTVSPERGKAIFERNVEMISKAIQSELRR